MMIKTTKTNDYLHINTGSSNSPEGSTLLMDNKVLQDFNNEYEQITCGQIKFFKFSGEIAELEEEEDVENSTSTDQVVNIDEDEEDEERDLTNLTWLTELRNQTMGFVHMALDEESKKDNELTTISVEQISIQQPSYHYCQQPEKEIPEKFNINILGQQNQRLIFKIPEHKSDETRATKTLNQPKRPLPAERYELFLNKIKRDLEIYEKSAINYQSDIVEKPPFNYSHIIGMAMLENGRRITLQQICSWIERKFAFFRVRKKWNNSIRHNLSLHPCFRKIGRNKEDKGKGGYWELGVDLKKCERRRIRNRKSSAQPFKMQKKHLQTHYVKLTRRKQQNMGSVKKINFKHCTENFKNIYTENEELLLDEMDVQQNVDVTSTHSNSHTNINSTETSNQHSELHIGPQQINPMIKGTK